MKEVGTQSGPLLITQLVCGKARNQVLALNESKLLLTAAIGLSISIPHHPDDAHHLFNDWKYPTKPIQLNPKPL